MSIAIRILLILVCTGVVCMAMVCASLCVR